MQLDYLPGTGTGRGSIIRRAVAMRGMLHRRYPFCFMRRTLPKIPLKIGIHLDLLPLIPYENRYDLLNALTDYTNRIPFIEWCGKVQLRTKEASYLRCLVEGAVRVDLGGNPAGVVSAESASYARHMLIELEKHLAYEQQRQDDARNYFAGKPDQGIDAGRAPDESNRAYRRRRQYHDEVMAGRNGESTRASEGDRGRAEISHCP